MSNVQYGQFLLAVEYKNNGYQQLFADKTSAIDAFNRMRETGDCNVTLQQAGLFIETIDAIESRGKVFTIAAHKPSVVYIHKQDGQLVASLNTIPDETVLDDIVLPVDADTADALKRLASTDPEEAKARFRALATEYAESPGWCIGDSADPDAVETANKLAELGLSPVFIETRCARYKGGHSVWAYGPIYTSRQAAVHAGHTHLVECASCGCIRYPL